jgi:exopolysaccharide biosynthesis protein
MKRTLSILLIILLTAIGATLYFDLNSNESDESKDNQDIQYIELEKEGVYIILFSRNYILEYLASTNTEFGDYAEEKNLTAAINGGYFLEDNTHAGLLILDGEQISPAAPTDLQVTHQVVINEDSSIDFKTAKNFEIENYLGKNVTVFQTGPLIIDENIVQTSLIKRSLNGEARYLRSILGRTDSGERFFAISRKAYDLKTLAEILLESDTFKEETISVVSLDGGSSTALYSESERQFNYNLSKELPFIIGVKR